MEREQDFQNKFKITHHGLKNWQPVAMVDLADFSFAKKFLPLCRSSKAKVQKALKYLGHVYAGSRQKLTKKSVLDAITWHHYYMNGHTATIQDFLGCTTFQP